MMINKIANIMTSMCIMACFADKHRCFFQYAKMTLVGVAKDMLFFIYPKVLIVNSKEYCFCPFVGL